MKTGTESTGTPPSRPPRRRGRRLRSAENIRVFVADVLRRVDAEPGTPLDPKRARVLLYGASILASLVVQTDFEERLRALEARAGGRGAAVGMQ